MGDVCFLDPSIPSPGEIWEWVQRVIEWIKLGGVALALLGSVVFLGSWVLSHLRRARSRYAAPLWSQFALWLSYVPVALTLVAAVASMVPSLTPWILKAFALAIITGALSWCVSMALLVRGGSPLDLSRIRRALLMAGTPWYCLALWLSKRLDTTQLERQVDTIVARSVGFLQ